MAGAETNYVFAVRAPILFERGRDNTSKLPVYLEGAAVLPTAGTYSLVDIAGNEVSAPSVTFGADNIASVTIPAGDLPSTLALGEGYSERWTLTVDGVVRSLRRDAVVARFEVHPPVSEADIIAGQYPDLLVDLAGFADSIQPWQDSAWRQVVRTMTRRGDFVDIVCEPSDLYDWYEHAVLERVFRALWKSSNNNDRYHELWVYHRDQAIGAAAGLRLKVDRDRDGLADSLAREPGSRSVHRNLPPRRYTRNPLW